MADLSKSCAELLTKEDALASMREAIEAARASVNLVMYRFADDSVGERMARSLTDAARRGARVRVIYDAIGSWATPWAFFEGLKAGGVEVSEYNPLLGLALRRSGWKRDHRKFLAVDGRLGFVGGMNLAEEYLGDGATIYDLGVRFEGEEAAVLETLFEFSWRRMRWGADRRRRRRRFRAGRFSGQAPIRIASNRFPRRHGIYRNLLEAIGSAARTIDIVNPYFLPPRRFLKRLHSAVVRGVRVRVLVPAWSDVFLLDLAMEGGFKQCLSFGVELYRWPGFVHAKTVQVDREWAAIGSFNFDYWSLLSNLEVMAFVRDPAFSESLGAELERQFAAAHRVTEAALNRRSLVRKALGRVLYRLRRWL